MDEYLFSTLSELADSYLSGLSPHVGTLADMELLTPHVGPSTWLLLAGKHLGATLNVTLGTQVREKLALAQHFGNAMHIPRLLTVTRVMCRMNCTPATTEMGLSPSSYARRLFRHFPADGGTYTLR